MLTPDPGFADGAGEGIGAPGGIAESEVEILLGRLAAQKDQMLRVAADFENFKRRNRLEAEAVAAMQKELFIFELLPIVDNLERALASDPPSGSKQFHQGVEMTLKQLLLLLSRHGIVSDAVVGQPFDPHRHDAIAQRSDPTQADHSILEVVQRGYVTGAKVLRPAKVVINDLTQGDATSHAG